MTIGTYEVTTVDARGYVLADIYVGTDWDLAQAAVIACLSYARGDYNHGINGIAEVWLMDSVNGRTTYVV